MQLNIFGQTYAAARTEDQILQHAPILLQLGTELREVQGEKVSVACVYNVPPLTMARNAAWRERMVQVINEVNGTLTPQMESMDAFMAGFMAAFFEFPGKILDLILEYSPDLPRAAIVHPDYGATDEEIVVAFSRIMTVAYPFFGMLGQMKVMAAAASARTSQR